MVRQKYWKNDNWNITPNIIYFGINIPKFGAMYKWMSFGTLATLVMRASTMRRHVIRISFCYGPIRSMTTQLPQPERARWMSVLAKAPLPVLADAVTQYGPLPAHVWLRKPETGLAMVRARTGGSGAQFNLGEMSVTRCTLRLASGEVGVAYLSGRDVRHAEWAALFDALMQTDARADVQRRVLQPIETALASQRAATHAQALATKVDFMTMVRGENT